MVYDSVEKNTYNLDFLSRVQSFSRPIEEVYIGAFGSDFTRQSFTLSQLVAYRGASYSDSDFVPKVGVVLILNDGVVFDAQNGVRKYVFEDEFGNLDVFNSSSSDHTYTFAHKGKYKVYCTYGS